MAATYGPLSEVGVNRVQVFQIRVQRRPRGVRVELGLGEARVDASAAVLVDVDGEDVVRDQGVAARAQGRPPSWTCPTPCHR